MLNYIRSELYRNFRTKGTYVLIGVCGGLLLAMNLVLGYFQRQGGFNYGNMTFTITVLLGAGVFLLAIALFTGAAVFGDEYKNGTLKNSSAYGFSRGKIFFGKQIAALLTAMICFGVIMLIFLVSGWILLEPAQEGAYQNLLRGLGAIVPNLAGTLAISITLMFLIDNSTMAEWASLGMLFAVPKVLEMFGMKFGWCAEAAKWFPSSAVSNVMTETGMIWDTTAGLVRCAGIGLAWTAAAWVIGYILFARKEIK
jgi:ABC-2 type transport system permease protein